MVTFLLHKQNPNILHKRTSQKLVRKQNQTSNNLPKIKKASHQQGTTKQQTTTRAVNKTQK